jgi:thymidylate kinase
MDTTELIDACTPDAVVIVGSLPPAGRDLDLLVRPAAEAALADALAAEGFRPEGRTWSRFVRCTAEVVELIAAHSLDVDPSERERLFAEAQPLEGMRYLSRPAPHHRLLLLAKRVAAQGSMNERRRAAISELDEHAWGQARAVAAPWRAGTALREVEAALQGRPPRAWRPRSTLVRARGYRHGALIALSGLDGSGKSTQAEALERALSKLGYRPVRVWTSLQGHPSLGRVAAPVRALLGAGPAAATDRHERPPAGEDQDQLTRLRESRPWLQLLWVTFVVLMNAWWQARATRPQLLLGRIVICDRYTLDSLVHLRYRYGAQRRYRAQAALIKVLSPRPLRAYLLEIGPQAAYARNREYTPAQVDTRARLYREEHAKLAVRRLDAELPREQLCAQIALDVHSALSARRGARGGGSLRRLLARHRSPHLD